MIRTLRAFKALGATSYSSATVIGIAQLLLGAFGIIAVGISLIFASSLSVGMVTVIGLRGVFAALTCLAGLWIHDGQRRGAFLAIACDLLQVTMLVLTAQWGIELMLAALLIVATVWLLPTLDHSPRNA